MKRDEMLNLIKRPSHVLIDAAKSGNIKFLDLAFQSNPELLKDGQEVQNLFQIAILSRQENLLMHLIEKTILTDFLILELYDGEGNNFLHLAGKSPPPEIFGSSRPHTQMQRELLWFKQVENRLPTLKTRRNKEGLTPKDMFDREHAKLHVDAGVATKDTANYGMLVATIIATIVFAASLTVPGHDASATEDTIFQKKGWYIIFILSNSIALFSSSSSIISFLSVLTWSFKQEDFISSLHVRLTFGVTTLFVATTAMVVAFTTACFLIFNHLSTGVAYLVASLGFITVAFFVLALYTLFGDLTRSFIWSLRLFYMDLTRSFSLICQRLKSHITAFIHTMKSFSQSLKIPNKFLKMCQTAKDKKLLPEDNPVAEP